MVALLAMWLVGMNAFAEGWVIVSVVTDPWVAAPSAGDGSLEAVIRAALVSGIAETQDRMLPLGVAELLLGGVLVAIAAKALFGRRASPSLAIQVIVANALVLVMGYALRQPVRERVVEAIVKSGLEQRPSGTSAHSFTASVRTKWWWSFRVSFSLQLVALGLSGIALTRRSARDLLAPEREPHAEEES